MRFLRRLQEQVGSDIDEEIGPNRAPGRGDPLCLQWDRVQPLAADNLILEIAADDAGLGQPGEIARALAGSFE